MDQRYNVYFAGQILEGHDPDAVRASLAKLFKADGPTLDRLFSGNTRLIKKDCDKATALKYKQAMERAGARPVIKASSEDGGGTAPSPPPAPAPEQEQSAAEKIAALAAAAGAGDDPSPSASEPEPESSDTLHLCPDGTEVLRPDERAAPVEAAIDTGSLEVEEAGPPLADPTVETASAPDTSHLSMGSVGEDIPNLPSNTTKLDPDTSSLDLSPEGTDFSDCRPEEVATPDLDLSAIDLAPAGSDVLREDERGAKPAPAAPSTDHISLSE